MRHVTGVLVRGTAGVMLATALLAGCGGGSDDPPETEKSSSEEAGTEEDLADMHEALDAVGDLIDEAGDAAGKYQVLVTGVRDKDPALLLSSPKVEQALAEQQELEDARNEAIADLGEMPGMDDPEVAAAYEEFAAAAEEMFTFQDGYNASMPQLLYSLDACVRIFDVKVEISPLTSLPGTYEAEWLSQHRKLSAPCLKALEPLAESENYRIQEYVESTQRVIDERNEAMTDIGVTDASMNRSLKQLKKANNSYIAREEKILAFSDELGKISAADEYQALHTVFEDKLGLVEGDAEPSESPTASPSK